MRIKRGRTRARERRRLLRRVKGYRWGRKNRIRQAKTAILKAGVHAYRDRKRKKRDRRQFWQGQINAAVRTHGMTYSRFMAALARQKIVIDRKILADLAVHEPKAFFALLDRVRPKR